MDLPFLAGLSNIDMLILIGAGLVFLVMAYMIFKQLMKAFVIGIISASIPVVLYLIGFQIELSLQTILWFGLAGISAYFVYDVITGWFKIMNILTWPIRKAFGGGKTKKPKEEKPKQKQEKSEPAKEKEGDKNRLQAREEKSKSDDSEEYEELK